MPSILEILIITEIITYLAFPLITGKFNIPNIARSDQMEQKILIVDLNFPETVFYMVIFYVAFKPQNI